MASAIINDSSVANNHVPAIDPSAPTGPILEVVNGKPRASSLSVAEHFKKRHDNVMRAITQTCHHLPSKFCALNFEETSVTVPGPKGGARQERAYLMTRDGFTLIVMGFTGKEAMAWKLRYIEAFNAMEDELVRQQTPSSGTITPSQQQELKELVQAKASAYPDNLKRKVFSQIWTRLQRRFKVPRYEELPVALFGEARDYVIAMPVRGVEPEAIGATPLPPEPRRNTLDDYLDMYGNLPPSPQYWMDLLSRYFGNHEALTRELDAVKSEAGKPFRVNRKSQVQTYFDAAALSPLTSLFEGAEQSLHLAYRQVFDALEGYRNVWLLLHKG